MKTLHKFIIKSYTGPMLLTLMIVVFIFLMQFLWLYIDELAGKGLSWHVLLEFIGWLSITFIPMALPLSTLLAALMTMGDLGESNELLALKASGISLNRIMIPLYGAILFVGVFSFFMSSNFVPYAYLQMRSMFRDIQKTRPELSIPEGVFYNGIDGFSIRVNAKDPQTGVLKGVMIYDHSKLVGNISLTIADSGFIQQAANSKQLVFRLINGVVYEEHLNRGAIDPDKRGFIRRSFKEQTVTVDLSNQKNTSNEGMFKDLALAKSLSDLNIARDSAVIEHQVLVRTFQVQYVFSHTSFASALELDTSYNKRALYPLNIDSVFNQQTALEKVNTLTQALVNSSRVKEYWLASINEIEAKTKQMNSLNLEWHRKLTLSLACIVFFFIGAPLGAIIRKGGLGMPVVISVFFFVIYWVVDSICQKMVKSDVWAPWFGAWLPSVIFIPVAVFLTYKANTDSQLFNPDSYRKLINRLLGRVEQLLEPINLDQIAIMNRSEFIQEKAKLDEYLNELNQLCDQFIKKHAKARLKLNAEFIPDLKWIQSKYTHLVTVLGSIDDDQRIRDLIKDYPQLNVEKYQQKELSKNMSVLATLFFPIQIAYIISSRKKYRQLKFMLSEISTINNNVRKTIQNGHTS